MKCTLLNIIAFICSTIMIFSGCVPVPYGLPKAELDISNEVIPNSEIDNLSVSHLYHTDILGFLNEEITERCKSINIVHPEKIWVNAFSDRSYLDDITLAEFKSPKVKLILDRLQLDYLVITNDLSWSNYVETDYGAFYNKTIDAVAYSAYLVDLDTFNNIKKVDIKATGEDTMAWTGWFILFYTETHTQIDAVNGFIDELCNLINKDQSNISVIGAK